MLIPVDAVGTSTKYYINPANVSRVEVFNGKATIYFIHGELKHLTVSDDPSRVINTLSNSVPALAR